MLKTQHFREESSIGLSIDIGNWLLMRSRVEVITCSISCNSSSPGEWVAILIYKEKD